MLSRLTLRNFTVFKDARIEFAPGVNVFIGANATGKTHAMKAAYALVRTARENDTKSPGEPPGDQASANRFAEKLAAVFRPDGGRIGRLVRDHPARGKASIALEVGEATATGEVSTPDAARLIVRGGIAFPASIFLPTREVLSIYPGFLAAYEDHQLAFDETYYDLCLALSAPALRGRRGEEAVALGKPLGECLKSKVSLQKGSFYLTSEDVGTLEAHLVAEGYRKIATLMHLIANGSLSKNGVLLWDEPEMNLNPKLTRVVAKFLFQLAASGVQIIIATHDYLLTNELSLNAEYQTDAARQAPIRFFSFSRGEDRSVSIQPGDTLAEIAENPIMEEFEALYDRERKLFYQADRVE